MQRKFLEDLGITDKDTIDKIIDENSTDIGKAKGELETVQKKLTDAEAEVETLKGQVSERDGQLETLKKSTGDVEELKKQIETLQTENKTKNEEYQAEIKKMKIDNAIDAALTAANAKNNIAVKALLKDLDKAELSDDGTVKGLQEQIDGLVKGEDTKFLFDSKKQQTKFKGAEPGKGDVDDVNDDNVDLSKMTYDERAKYFEEHPDIEV
jgi:septal ring factor EnvC (AmiA/AmiB activator)